MATISLVLFLVLTIALAANVWVRIQRIGLVDQVTPPLPSAPPLARSRPSPGSTTTTSDGGLPPISN